MHKVTHSGPGQTGHIPNTLLVVLSSRTDNQDRGMYNDSIDPISLPTRMLLDASLAIYKVCMGISIERMYGKSRVNDVLFACLSKG